MPWDVVADKFAGWFTGLKFLDALIIFLVVALVATVVGMGYWIGGTVLPAQTKQIQIGYEAKDKEHREERESIMQAHQDERANANKENTERLKLITESFKDAMDRYDKQADKRDVLLEKFVRKIDKDMP